MRGQRVSGEHRVDVARLDDLGERRAREAVERERRPHHPHDVAVFALVLQQLVELVVLAGERRLARAPQAEGEVVGVAPCVGQLAFAVRRGVEPGRVDVDALLSRLGAPAHDGISRADVAELAHEDASVLADGNAVHAAVFREQPCAVDLEVLGVDAHRVVAFWRHAVFRRRQQHGVGRAGQRLAVEVGSGVGVQCEAHGLPSLQGRLRTSGCFRSHAIIHGDEAKASEDSPASRARAPASLQQLGQLVDGRVARVPLHQATFAVKAVSSMRAPPPVDTSSATTTAGFATMPLLK